jgi:Ser/Thr protein kinase RdoA (MazF antagonist)
MAVRPPAAAIDNRPGSATCPGWLLCLDDPAPGRVLFVGLPDPAIVAWFQEQGARAEVIGPADRPPAPPDVLVLDAAATRSAHGPLLDPVWLAGTGAVVLARTPSGAWARALTKAGLGTIRLDGRERRRHPGHRSGGQVHVAVPTRRDGGAAGGAPLPSWLHRVVTSAVPEVRCRSWDLRVPTAYPSQKAVARVNTSPVTDDALVVKVTRHPRFNARLENESDALRTLHRRGGEIATRIPVERGRTEVAGMAATVQDAILGQPFLEASALVAHCPVAEDAVRAITDLGAATHRAPDGLGLRRGPEEASSLDGLRYLLHAFLDQQQPSRSTAAFLTDQVGQLLVDPPPTVLFHGDLGTWNLLVDEDERVCILDWESAEIHGPPLWDLFYFLRSYAVRAGRRRGLDRSHAIGRHLLGSSPIAHQAAAWVEAYCWRLGIEGRLVEPLLHTCWMQRAVKEQQRLGEGRPGHYGPLCLQMVEQRDAPGLRRLLGR